MNILLQILCLLTGYLIGAFPTARLLTSFTSQKNVLTEGSGNAGAMNAYRVSGQKWVGVLTAVIDIAKGFLAVRAGVAIGAALGTTTFMAPMLCGIFVVLGHNYSIFQKMRGGRGLAPAAGVMLAANPLPAALFVLMWLTGYFVIRRDVHAASMVAICGVAILMYNVPEPLVQMLMQIPIINEKQSIFTVLVYLILLQLFVRHLEPIRALLGNDDREERT